MAQLFRVVVTFNMGGHGRGSNSFTFRDLSPTALIDSVVLAAAQTWVENIYGPLRASMSSGWTSMGAILQELDFADGKVIRNVGGFSPSVSGLSSNDPLPTSDAGGALARTNIPKVRGTKRFGGLGEGQSLSGYLINTAVSNLAAATAQWIAGNGLGLLADAGVWSAKVGDFVPFNGSGLVTNIFSTQVTRKTGRGS